jgi:hypothetical protein
VRVAITDVRGSGVRECSGAGDFEFLNVHHANIIAIGFAIATEGIESFLGSS